MGTNEAELGRSAGDGPLLPETVERFRPALLRYLAQHLRQYPEDIEDVAQEALLRLHRASGAGTIDNPEAYVIRIASNLVRDLFRRRPPVTALDDLPKDRIDAAGAGEVPGPDRVYEDNRRLKVFLVLLDELPPRCREVFLLQRFEGLTYSAIASRLGISVSGVEKHMMKALLHFDRGMDRA